jgi:predicted permease
VAVTLYDVSPSYAAYLLLHFPVLGLAYALPLAELICRLFPDKPRGRASASEASQPWSAAERRLMTILVIALLLWASDTVHGVSPAWIALAAAVARLAGESGPVLAGAAMAAGFPNVGNFGIPVATFAFGAVGRTTAVVFVLVQNVLLYTLGVYALARGSAGRAEERPGEGTDGERRGEMPDSEEKSGRRTAAERVLSLPITWAVVAAGLVVLLDLVPPEGGPAMRTIGLVGDASIPLFLLILGLQLASMSSGTAIRRVLPTAGVKLLVAPAVAVGIALAAGIAGSTAGRAFVLLAAGAAAVTPLVLAVEFAPGDERGSEERLSTADYVGTVVVLTIFGSLPVVTALLLLLRAGAA